MIGRFSLFSVALAMLAPIMSITDENWAGPSENTLRQWVNKLRSKSFQVRQDATRNLIQSRSASIPFVRDASQSDDREVAYRAIEVLYALSTGTDAEARTLARDALNELAESSTVSFVARSAQAAIRRRAERHLGRLERLGGRVSFQSGKVIAISFVNSSVVRDEDLSVLLDFADLKSLTLQGTNVGDNGMKYVSRLSKLERLDLYRTKVGDRGLKYLKGLRNLTELPMGVTNVTDAGLFHLREMTQLKYLGLRADAITDDGLINLRGLSNLTGLYLGETQVTDAGLAHIQHCTELNELRLHTMNISDGGLVHLKAMTKLTFIEVYETNVTENGVENLKEWFPRCQVTHASRRGVRPPNRNRR